MADCGELIIDLGAISRNYRIIDGVSADTCKTAVCVKANAYGLGVEHVAPALYKSGARHFFVATLDEGIELRSYITDAQIYVLNGFVSNRRNDYHKHRLTPVLNSLAEISLYKSWAHEIEVELPAIIHFDTGMNRLGLGANETEILCADKSLIAGLDLKYIMSHFSSSDEKENPVNDKQYQEFLKISGYFKDVKLSLCNSDGILLSHDYHMDLTRTGIALYKDNVISLSAPILQIYDVNDGDAVGYNEAYRFHGKSSVAIISIGYADGILRSLSNDGALYWRGFKMPIRGNISMDLLTCDLCNVPDEIYPEIGDMVEVVGEHQSISDLARDAGSISYEMLTNIGSRYKKSYC